MKWLDIPPVWLAACLVCAYFVRLGLPAMPTLGALCVVIGLALMILAVWELRKHRTTPIPHMQADALVTTGVFSISRNPIYLGDLIVLFGLSLRWGSLIGIALIPVLFFVLQRRFILPEEGRLKARFGENFAHYSIQTRRWL